jgi:1-acyl-sn-glycerol-3-phosphate acyltransferase
MALDSAVQSSKYFRAYAERGWMERQWIRFSHWTVGLYFRFCCRLRIEGEEHIPAQGGVLLASNHISMLDALLIPYAVMPLKGMQVVWSPAKEELFRIPVLRQILLSWGSFPVRRGRNDLRVMRRIVSLLSTGKMMLFPEGRRSRDGDLQAGNRMVGRFIYRAQPVVVPTVVSGTNHTFPQGAWLPRFGVPMMVRFGPPVDLKRYYDKPDSKQTSEAIIQDVMQAIAALQKMSASYPAPDSNQNP